MIREKENVMIDIETMGLHSDAVVLSIGAVFFDEKGLGKEFYEKVDMQSCIDLGLTIDASTLYWWMEQSESARKEFVECQGSDIVDSMGRLTGFLKEEFRTDQYPGKVWSNGTDFDLSILKTIYRKLGMEVPWKYYNQRDFRTYRKMASSDKTLDYGKGTAHNALNDAKWQAMYCRGIMLRHA